MIQMMLGNFPFSLYTAAYEELERATAYRWAAHERVGKRSTHQFLGIDDETIDLHGVMFPAFQGQPITLQILRNMAAAGKPYILISGTGNVFGDFMVLDVRTRHAHLMDTGAAQKIDFSVSLKRYDDEKNPLESIIDTLLG